MLTMFLNHTTITQSVFCPHYHTVALEHFAASSANDIMYHDIPIQTTCFIIKLCVCAGVFPMFRVDTLGLSSGRHTVQLTFSDDTVDSLQVSFLRL